MFGKATSQEVHQLEVTLAGREQVQYGVSKFVGQVMQKLLWKAHYKHGDLHYSQFKLLPSSKYPD